MQLRYTKKIISVALGAILAAGTVTTAAAPPSYAGVVDSAGNTMDPAALSTQISWLDFGEAGVISGVPLGAKKEISVGTVYTKEIYPGYVVRAEVVALQPLMVDNENWGGQNSSGSRRGPAAVIAKRQDARYSHLAKAGIKTGSALTNLGAQYDGGNVGMTLRFTAESNGVRTLPTIIVADGEEATDQEFEVFKTTGTPWQLLAEARANERIPSYRESHVNLDKSCSYCWKKNTHTDHTGAIYDNVPWLAYNADAPNHGLGTQTFGPIVTSFQKLPTGKKLETDPATQGSVPIVMTSALNTTDNFDVSFYVNSPGIQTVQFGIVVLEEGDAPTSFGRAAHLIREATGTTQPYLGSMKPDVLQNPNPQAGDWNRDDLSDAADEGIAQLRNDGSAVYVPYYGADKSYTLPVYVTPGSADGQPTPAYVRAWADFNNNGKFDANEMGTVEGEITQAGTYNVVFNNIPQTLKNGVSDLGVRVRVANSQDEIATPTGIANSGEVEDFKIRLLLPPRGEKKTSEGPQGEEQSAKVNFTARGRLAPAKEALEADGSDLSGGQTNENAINTDEPVRIVRPDNGELTDSWTEEGEGKYTVESDGTVKFQPEPSFFGAAKGVILRAKDLNGNTTGWTSNTEAQHAANAADAQAAGISVSTLYEAADNINSNGEGKNIYGAGVETMDGVYIPTVLPFNIQAENKESHGPQGQPQEKTMVFKRQTGETLVLEGRTQAKPYFVTASGEKIDATTIDALDAAGAVIGTYTLNQDTGTVVFMPHADFTGRPQPAYVKLEDREEVAGMKPTLTSATATYQPSVEPLPEIVATPVTSVDSKDVNQFGTPTFANADSSPLDLEGAKRELLDKDGQPAPNNTTSAYKDGQVIGTYTLDPDTGVVTFDPNADFVGEADPARVKLTTRYGKSAVGVYTPTVRPTPVGTPVTSSDWQGVPQTGTPTFTQGGTDGTAEPLTPSAQNPAKLVAPGGDLVERTPATNGGKNVGTYTIDPATAVVTFVPNLDFYGTPDPVTVSINDKYGQAATATYTPTVKRLEPKGTDVTSEGKQGATQTGTPIFTDGKGGTLTPAEGRPARFIDPESGDAIEGTELPAKQAGKTIGTYTLDPATGTVTFKPNKDFHGNVDGVTVQLTDLHGNTATGKYTPRVTPLVPTGTNVTSTGPQGAEQTGLPTYRDGEGQPLVPSEERRVTFVNPKTKEPIGDPFVPAYAGGEVIGRYSISPETGVITFTPNASFVGTADPVEVQIQDDNGTRAYGTYTPTVTPLVPAGSNVTSEGPQGEPQSKTLTWTDGKNQPLVPSEDRPARLVDPQTGKPTDKTEIPATFEDKVIGTYVIEAHTGKITFTPNPSFTGTADPARAVLTDDNGTAATSTYTPTVTPVVPEGVDVTSEGWQGEIQTGTPTFKDGKGGTLVPSAERPARFIDPVTGQVTEEPSVPAKKDGETIGTYVIDPATGTVTFTPNKSFTGTPDPVTIQVNDKNGTPATGKYTPLVKPLAPRGTPATTTEPQTETHTTTVNFVDGQGNAMTPSAQMPVNLIDPNTGDKVTEIAVPGVGTYTVVPETGVITFVPEVSFVGNAPAIEVVMEDSNGTPARTTYTPIVTPKPPVGEPATSTGDKGKTQTGTPTFTGGSGTPLHPSPKTPVMLIDPNSAKPVTSLTIPDVGTYNVIPETGLVSFTPEPNFVGEAPSVTVEITDENSLTARTTYTPTVVEPAIPAPTPEPTPVPGDGPGQSEGQSGVVVKTPSSVLASTGSTATTLLGGAILLLLVGGAVVLLKRK